MKNMPLAVKILLNLFFFLVYLLISVVLWNFLFGLVLNFMWKTIPWSQDPIHMKIAIVICFLVFLFTLLFRKYFYIILSSSENILLKEENNYTNRVNELEENFVKKEETPIVSLPTQSKETELKPVIEENDNIKIYIWKEKNKLK